MKLCKIALTPPIAAIIVSLGLMFDAFATDRYVSADGSYGAGIEDAETYTDLQAAITAAKAGETVWVKDGFVCETGLNPPLLNEGSLTTNRIEITTAITVRSESGCVDEAAGKGATIRGAYAFEDWACTTGAVRCVGIKAGATFFGFVLENGASRCMSSAGGGGGLYVGHASAVVSNCVIRNNYGFKGGGVWVNANALVSNCIVSNNTAKGKWQDKWSSGWEGSGAGVYGSGRYADCRIIGNTSVKDGGGVSWSGAEMTNCLVACNTAAASDGGGFKCTGSGFIRDTVISNNTVTGKGGGVSVAYMGSAKPVFYDCVVISNTASGDGGGVWSQDNPATYIGGGAFVRCRIEGNKGGSGGGVYGMRVFVTNCVIRANTCSSNGGGVYAPAHEKGGVDVRFCNTLIADNVSSKWGGGVYASRMDGVASTARFVNCTVAGNTAGPLTGYSQGGFEGGGAEIVNTICSGNSGQVDYNSVYAATNCCIRFKSDVDPETKGPGNFDKDPKFVGSGEMPYMIERTSPCRNKGLYDPDDPFFAWMTDGSVGSWALNGVERVSGSKPDLGCYEVKSYGLMMLLR